jgi:hypothetical protein
MLDPIFQYVGNAFNGTAFNAAPGAGWLNGNQTIVGKKFIDEKSAYRVLVRLGFTSQTYKSNVNGDANSYNCSSLSLQQLQQWLTDKFCYQKTLTSVSV